MRSRLGLRYRVGFQACLAPYSPSPQSHREESLVLGTLSPPLPASLTCGQVELSVFQTFHFLGIYGGFYLPSLITSEGKERARSAPSSPEGQGIAAWPPSSLENTVCIPPQQPPPFPLWGLVRAWRVWGGDGSHLSCHQLHRRI